MRIVILDEDDPVRQVVVARVLVDFLDDPLAALVLGVRLAGEDELHGPLRIVDELEQPVGLGEKEAAALVGREAPREADREDLGIEDAVHLPQLRRALAEALALPPHPLARERHEPALELLVRVPEHLVGDAVDAQPVVHVGEVLLPILAEILGIEVHELGRGPRLGVDAVGDAGDGHLVLGHARPDILPETLGDFPVQLADAVGAPAGAQREDGHREVVRRVDRSLPEAEEVVEVDADLRGVIAEIVRDEFAGEGIVARRHGRVGREDARRRDDLEGRAEIELVGAHEVADALQAEERGVALVHVVDGGLEAERGERAGSAHAQDDLLADAHFQVATVELGGDGAVLGVVFGDVGVEQVEG